jgi:hypothetical protein
LDFRRHCRDRSVIGIRLHPNEQAENASELARKMRPNKMLESLTWERIEQSESSLASAPGSLVRADLLETELVPLLVS